MDGQAEREEADGDRRCIVRVKLFNAVMREHGPLLVSRGILLEPERIKAALGTPLPPATLTSRPRRACGCCVPSPRPRRARKPKPASPAPRA
jgi:hypothetical protein